MIRILTVCLLWAASLISAAAASGLSAAKCFSEAPLSEIPLLSASTRLDMLDYFHAGSAKTSKNSVDGNARISAEDDYSISFQITDGIEGQMFVLNPQSACPIIGYIETVSLPLSDSTLKLYDCRWQPLEIYHAPSIKDWVRDRSKSSLEQLKDMLPFILTRAEYDPEKQQLALTNVTPEFFTGEDKEKIRALMRSSITMEWNGSKFKIKR